MKSKMGSSRYSAHTEKGGRSGSQSSHMSHGSPASKGASIGPGPMPGTDQLASPGAGPGPAARRKMGRDVSETPTYAPASSATPRGMSVNREE